MEIQRAPDFERLDKNVPYFDTHRRIFGLGMRNYLILTRRGNRSVPLDLDLPAGEPIRFSRAGSSMNYLHLLDKTKTEYLERRGQTSEDNLHTNIRRKFIDPKDEYSDLIEEKKVATSHEVLMRANAAGFGIAALQDKDPERVTDALYAFEIAEILEVPDFVRVLKKEIVSKGPLAVASARYTLAQLKQRREQRSEPTQPLEELKTFFASVGRS